MSQRAKGFSLIILSAVVFGMIPLIVRSVNDCGSNSIMTSFLRFALSLIPLYISVRAKGASLAITKSEAAKILLIAVCGFGGTSVLLFLSYHFIPSGMATTIHFVYPVVVILGSVIFLKQKLSRLKLLCVALCFGGILLFYNGGDGTLDPLGMLFAFASGITYSFYIVYLDFSGLAKMEPTRMIFYMNTFSALMVGSLAVATGSFTLDISLKGWILALLLAISVSFLAVRSFQMGVRYIGPQNAAILSTFEPITSLVVGILVYQEALTAAGIAGCVLILSSVVITARMEE